jgi:hypothetical protein
MSMMDMMYMMLLYGSNVVKRLELYSTYFLVDIQF